MTASEVGVRRPLALPVHLGILGSVSTIAALIVAVGGAEASATTYSDQNGRIAYTAVTGGGTDVFLVNADGTNSTRLTYNTSDHSPHTTGSGSPSWSPDGTTIAYAGFDGTHRAIFTIPATGGSPTQITESTTRAVSSPAWSPDGSAIAFSGTDGSDYEIFVVPVAGGAPTNVTDSDTNDIDPTWSPDGSTIAFARRGHTGHSRDFDLFTIPASGGVSTQLTSGPWSEGSPSWSPDGSRIAFSASTGDGGTRSAEIFTIPAAGGTPTNLTNNDIADQRPTWSPDGSMIAYESESGHTTNYSQYSFDIVTMPATGGVRVNVTNTTGSEGNPAWGRAPSDRTGPETVLQSLPTFSVKARQVVRWTGSDAGGSGIASFQLRYRVAPWKRGFGSWVYPTRWQEVSPSRSSVRTAMPEGRTKCVSARAVDHAGNVGSWSPERCTTRPLDDKSLKASASWSTVEGSSYYEGSARATSMRGQVLSKHGAQGRQIALVVTTCPTCGKVRVSIGGERIGTVNLYSPTRKDRQLKVLPAFSDRSGTVSVKSTTAGLLVQVDGLAIAK